MLAIMNHLEPIEAGETQICSDGLRISSYTMEESGLPFVSDFSIRQALESKRAFDEMWVAINEPEPEPDPIEVKAFVPALPVAAPVAVPIQVKQPASSVPSGTADALEEHTAALIVVEVAEPHKQDDPVPYAEVSLVPEMAPCIALADAESGHSGSQKASEPVLDGLGVVGEGRDSAEIGQKPLENSGYFEPETAQATPYEEIPLLVPVQIRGTEDECTEYNARRARRDPWKHYPKPAASPRIALGHLEHRSCTMAR
jgi:hypothetical protein